MALERDQVAQALPSYEIGEASDGALGALLFLPATRRSDAMWP